jgi:glutamine amidotransferase
VRVTIFDYGAGNLHSLAKSLALPDVRLRMDDDPARAVVNTDVLVLPGVGAFGAAAARLAPGLQVMRDAVLDGLPCLGICLGMQLLFDRSDEGTGSGLGVIAGRVCRLQARRIPHIGWNTIDDARDPLLRTSALRMAYYANSYVCQPSDATTIRAWTLHERDRFPAMVRAHRAVGVQFHPEKSSAPGVALVHAFLREARS